MEPWADRQAQFAAALLDTERAMPEGLVGPDGRADRRRFEVYRNNVYVGLIDALRASFPCVLRLVGEEFFAAMARAFVAAAPPRSPVLLRYGAEFPAFIEAFPPAASLPWLADVARIERAATEAYHGPDVAPLDPAALASVPPAQAPDLRFTLHPTLRWVRSSFPAFTIWQMNTADGVPAPVDLSVAQDVLILRPEVEVDVRHVPPAGIEFLLALAGRATLSHAAACALASDESFDLEAHLRELIHIGALVDFEVRAGEGADEALP